MGALWFPRVLSFLTGFLSLSQEILWIRYAGFAQQGKPIVFSTVLGLFLIGIAIGAQVGKRFCARGADLYRVAGLTLLVAAAGDVLLPWIFAVALEGGHLVGYSTGAVAIVMTALLKSIVFPIAHHLGSAQETQRVGSSVSKVYFANVFGSTMGPLVTGYVLLEMFSLERCFGIVALATLGLSALCLNRSGRGLNPVIPIASLAAAVVMLVIPVHDLLPRLIYATGGHRDQPITRLQENRYGIIHTRSNGGDEIVFGGNAYDGSTNTSLRHDTNRIRRAYVMAAAAPDAKRVLVIGMSGGAWLRVVRGYQNAERIDVVEINPGYIKLVEGHPELSLAFQDPRVAIHIDDGRRWLRRHPDEKFDIILMNTTYHWRAYITNLLSQEFLALLRQHLNPRGAVGFNATSSPDVFKTASTVFPHVYAYADDFVIASDSDLAANFSAGAPRIFSIAVDGEMAMDPSEPDAVDLVDRALSDFRPLDEVFLDAGRPAEIITQQNMITEYKYGRGPVQRLLQNWR